MRWFITTAAPPGILSRGAFRFVRHPLYLASMLFYLGLSVATMSVVCIAFMVPVFLFYNYIAAYEEKLLEEKFGDAYSSYRLRTGKWVPKSRNAGVA